MPNMRTRLNFISLVFVFLILLFIFSFSLVSAFSSNNVGKIDNMSFSSYVPNQTDYSPGENIKGSVNISLNSESSNSSIDFYSGTKKLSSMNLLDFLVNSGLSTGSGIYFCNPSSCEDSYSSSDSGETIKSFSLTSGKNLTLGIKLTSNPKTGVTGINNFTINISSDAVESCSVPLKIEIPEGGLSFMPSTVGNSYCTPENYACFGFTNSQQINILSDAKYCSIISVNSGAAIDVGADLVGDGAAQFQFSIDSKSCLANFTSSQTGQAKAICRIDKAIVEPTNLTLCMTKKSGGTYNIFYRDSDDCASIQRPSEEATLGGLSLFIKPLNYASPGALIINSTSNPSILSGIKSYLSDNYDSNCSLGCFVPIKFSSNSVQNLQLSKFNLSYNAGTSNANLIYELKKVNPTITMNFTKFNLDSSGFIVPSTPGNYTLYLKLNGVNFYKNTLNVLDVPSVVDIFPKEVPAGVKFKINVLSNNSEGIVEKYVFNFSDGNSSF